VRLFGWVSTFVARKDLISDGVHEMNLLTRKTGHGLIRVRVISWDLFCGPALYG
jgi:hypothetical protein